MRDPAVERLADRWSVVILVRLVVASPGDVIYGEAVDVETSEKHQFQGWSGLDAAMRARVRAVAGRRGGWEKRSDTGGHDLG